MKLKEHNEMIHSLFEMELDKIPRCLRMTPNKKMILKGLFYFFTTVEILIICWFPRWYDAALTSVVKISDGNYVVNEMIPSGYITAVILGLLPFIPLLLYVLFVYLFERTAYVTANSKAIEIAEDRRLFTRGKDLELIRKLNNDDTVGIIKKEEKTYPPGQSLEEEIDNFFKR